MTKATETLTQQPLKHESTTLRRAVKARIAGAGLSMGSIAKAAGISQSSLSNHVLGIRRSRETQYRIWRAFCDLARNAGHPVSDLPGMTDFWGVLLAGEVAA